MKYHRIREAVHRHRFVIALMGALALCVPNAAFASGTLDIDLTPLFDQINYWVTQLFPILSIGVGIAIAIALIGFVGSSIKKAFVGGKG